MKGFTTKALHGGALASHGLAHGALRAPVHDCVAFEQASAAGLEEAFGGSRPAHVYTRITNPTLGDFEEKIRLLTGGQAVVAVSSGMAAIANAIMVIGGPGRNIVTTRHIFGNTFSLFTKTLAAWGLATRFCDMTNPAAVARSIDERTCAVFLETITNPQLEVADCRAIVKAAAERGVPVILDNTLATPYLFNSRRAGVAVEVISSTKYISGGGTTVGGLVIDNGRFDWRGVPSLAAAAARFGPLAFTARLRREVYRNLGSCLSPHNASMQSLGLETLALRVEKSSANALALAEHLSRHPAVRGVHYPGLATSHFHEIAARQFNRRFGGILTFDLADKEECFALMDNLSLIRRATNVNDNKTLILHPASTIAAEYDDAEREAMGVRSTMLRLSAGIEDIEDIIEDLDKGLSVL